MYAKKKKYEKGGILDKLKSVVSKVSKKKEEPKEFDKTGYKFLGKSDDLDAIAHRKKHYTSTHSGQQDYKFTEDSEGKTNLYVKMEEGGMFPKYKKGGKLGKRKALDFNKDGKITKEDFAMLRGMAKNKKKKGKKVPKAAVGLALAGVAKIAAPLIKKAVIGSAVNAVKKGVDKQVNKAIG